MRDINFRISLPGIVLILVIWNHRTRGLTTPNRPERVRARPNYYPIYKNPSIQRLAATSLMVSATKINLIPPRRTYGPYHCPQPLVVWAAYYITVNGPQASPGCTRVPWPFTFNRPFFAWATYYSTSMSTLNQVWQSDM